METHPFKVADLNVPEGAFSNGDPVRCIKSVTDMPRWENSQAYNDVLGFINGVSSAIQGVRISDDVHICPTIHKLLEIFADLHKLIDEVPPVDQPQRFGNKSYRQWYHRLQHSIFKKLQDALPQSKCQFLQELGVYFSESFGNATRIDYGTGHEFSFIFFLCSLFKAEILGEDDIEACALRLFTTYLSFVRRLQMVYRMEPAGSQGVWSLDDYQFVPFIWGSAQLAYRAPFEPAKFLDADIIEKYKDDYIFIGCIDYISKVKTGHFAEHSNQLWSITAVPSWTKINQGLVKMYQKELLSKYPVMQHVLFGRLMSINPRKPGSIIAPARLGHPPKFLSSSKDSSSMPPPMAPPMSKIESTPNVEAASSAIHAQLSKETSQFAKDHPPKSEQGDHNKDDDRASKPV